MIKRCPSCNRTYSDESLSFCLADGALLSAPYSSGREEAPPTEIFPPPTRAPAPPTQPVHVAVPTITSLPDHRRDSPADHEAPRKTSTISWILFALGASALIAGGVLLLRYAWRDNSQTANTATQPGTLIVANGTPSPAISSDVSQPESNSSPVTNPPATDSSKVFSSGEVEQKVKILSKPEPSYTAEARQNHIVGTVVLSAVFSSNGEVTDIHAVSGLPDGLTERAMAAAKQIKFVPAIKDGRPVSVSMQLQYNFNLY